MSQTVLVTKRGYNEVPLDVKKMALECKTPQEFVRRYSLKCPDSTRSEKATLQIFYMRPKWRKELDKIAADQKAALAVKTAEAVKNGHSGIATPVGRRTTTSTPDPDAILIELTNEVRLLTSCVQELITVAKNIERRDDTKLEISREQLALFNRLAASKGQPVSGTLHDKIMGQQKEWSRDNGGKAATP